jgi:hypothetical protein
VKVVDGFDVAPPAMPEDAVADDGLDERDPAPGLPGHDVADVDLHHGDIDPDEGVVERV